MVLPRCIAGVVRSELRARSAAIDATDAEGKESFAIGSNEPGNLALLLK